MQSKRRDSHPKGLHRKTNDSTLLLPLLLLLLIIIIITSNNQRLANAGEDFFFQCLFGE